MLTDYQTRANRLKKPSKAHDTDLRDWRTALAFVGLLVLMKYAIDGMMFWIDYSIINLHNF